jgi:hypothetical protein
MSIPRISMTLSDEFIIEAFYRDCDPEVAAFGQSRLQQRVVAPISTPDNISNENFGRVKHCYITSLQDRAIPIVMQVALPFQSILIMDSFHSLFLFVREMLADKLLQLEDGQELMPKLPMKHSNQQIGRVVVTSFSST